MPLALSRAPLPHVAGILACGAALATSGACHPRSSGPPGPSPAERAAVAPSLERDGRLAQRHPGVAVMSTGSGGFVIRILSGLARGGEPLYIIDGHPMTVDPRRGINWFKPEDIAQITVLKTPVETAVYGPRGAHGVILIATKQAAARRK